MRFGWLTLGHSPWAIRLGAVVFGAAITLLVGSIGWMLKGPWAGAAAAAIYAVVGVGPHVQGFTFNGEIAAALHGKDAALRQRRQRCPARRKQRVAHVVPLANRGDRQAFGQFRRHVLHAVHGQIDASFQ